MSDAVDIRGSGRDGEMVAVGTWKPHRPAFRESAKKVRVPPAHRRCISLKLSQVSYREAIIRQRAPGPIHPVGALFQVVLEWVGNEMNSRPTVFFFEP